MTDQTWDTQILEDIIRNSQLCLDSPKIILTEDICEQLRYRRTPPPSPVVVDVPSVEEARKILLGDSMPMIAGKMSKSGNYENVEYIELDKAIHALLERKGGV